MLTDRQISEKYFVQSKDEPSKWTCKTCHCIYSQKIGSGHRNLAQHFKSRHDAVLQEDARHEAERQAPFEAFSHESVSLHGWIELIVKKNLPLQIVEDPLLRRHIKLAQITRNTLVKYLKRLYIEVINLLDCCYLLHYFFI